jgi:hypothetical protein
MAASLSLTADENARKGEALFLRAIEKPGKGVALAEAMDTSNTKISNMKNGTVVEVIRLLALLGLQVRPSDYVLMHPVAYEYHKWLHANVMRNAPHLLTEPDA